MGQPTEKKRVSLREISEAANVTKSTASRILNNAEGYKYAEETVRRVLQVAREKGYETNQFYRSAFTGRTHSAGVVAPPGSPFYGPIIRGVHDRLLEDGYATILGINATGESPLTVETSKKVIRRLNAHRVDGFIMHPRRSDATDEHFQDIIEAGLPLVVIDLDVDSHYADYVGSDNETGGRLAATYLAELGHRQIVQFAHDQRSSSYRSRAVGFETELIERGCNIQTAICGKNEDLLRKCELLFSRPERPTAAFCADDSVACLVLRKLAEMGLSVPGDVSLVGFGNLREAHLVNPPLTTIDQDPHAIGVAAAELFLKWIAHPKSEERKRESVLIGVKLVERESCRPL